MVTSKNPSAYSPGNKAMASKAAVSKAKPNASKHTNPKLLLFTNDSVLHLAIMGCQNAFLLNDPPFLVNLFTTQTLTSTLSYNLTLFRCLDEAYILDKFSFA
jgi:hypothetical protein